MDPPSMDPSALQQHQSQALAGSSSSLSPSSTSPTSAQEQRPQDKQQDKQQSADVSPATGDGRSRETTVPSACLGCRSKHLKCDGQNPCSRCVASSSECVYIASRRGYKGPRRGAAQNSNKRQATSPPDVDGGGGELGDAVSASTPAVALGTAESSFNSNGRALGQDDGAYRPYCGITGGSSSSSAVNTLGLVNRNGSPSTIPMLSRQTPLPERCLDSFYHHFHPAHPFALPKQFLLPLSKEPSLAPLLAAMRWAGSLYIDVPPDTRADMLDAALRLLYDPQAVQDGFRIQAMIVLIVALDGCCQQERARDILTDAERLAVQLAINTRPYATLHGRGMPVLEESWRRTWWDLFVVDGMIAGVHRTTHFLLFDIPCDVALPCEEYQFTAGAIPRPMYLEDLEDRDFSLDDRHFSSFAYRILCARNLGRFMRSPPIFGPDDANLARIEALLTNWRLHLPATKKDALRPDGSPDEMMFQAHMMLHATSILLHQPHSQLDSSPTQSVDSCAPHRAVPAGDAFNAHTRHTVTSANEISRLVTLRVPLLTHTHFFTCVVTLSSIVHLSKWALNFNFAPNGVQLIDYQTEDDDLRQQIRLNIGALNRLADVWSAADMARGQVKAVAHEIYQVKKQQQLNPQYWLGLSQEEMVNSIAADDTIISEIDSFSGLPGTITPNLLG